MPRQSAADLGVVRIRAEEVRVKAPKHLTAAERDLFNEIVESSAANHFIQSDIALLASYVQSILLARGAIKKAATDPAALATWEKATRMQATLATRLRLAPQARCDPKTVGRHRPDTYPRPWETRDAAE
jgi:hypothetical protein